MRWNVEKGTTEKRTKRFLKYTSLLVLAIMVLPTILIYLSYIMSVNYREIISSKGKYLKCNATDEYQKGVLRQHEGRIVDAYLEPEMTWGFIAFRVHLDGPGGGMFFYHETLGLGRY